MAKLQSNSPEVLCRRFEDLAGEDKNPKPVHYGTGPN